MAFSNFRNGDTRCPSSRDGSVRDRIEIEDKGSNDAKLQFSPQVQRQFTPPTEHGGQFCPLDADPTKAYTKNGIKVLPQPTADPLDPLNWKKWEKNVILGIVMLNYFLLTYATNISTPGLEHIQSQFSLSFDQANWSLSLCSLGAIVGPLILTSLADIYGRRIIKVVCTAIAFAATIGVAMASDFPGYLIARAFQGLGVSPPLTVGMGTVGDIFFDYERGQKLGLWMMAANTGFLLAPLCGGILVDVVGANWDNWLSAILLGLLLLLQLFLMPETLYPRTLMLSKMPKAHGVARPADQEKALEYTTCVQEFKLKRTKELSFFNLSPVPGLKHPKVWDTAIRFLHTFRLYVVSISCMVLSCFAYSWVVAVITSLPLAYDGKSAVTQGLVYVGLLVGTVTTELLWSGRSSDRVVLRLAKKNNNVRVAEMRIWMMYPALAVTVVGVSMWGISVEKNMHWMVGQIALFLLGGGSQLTNTAVISYCIDAYPMQSMSILTFFGVMLNTGTFISPFFISPWIRASGWTWTFAVQGMIVAGGVIPAFALLHRFGDRLRNRSPRPSWVNPEFDTTN